VRDATTTVARAIHAARSTLAHYNAAIAPLHLPGGAGNWGSFGIANFHSIRRASSKDCASQHADSDDLHHDEPPVGWTLSLAVGELSVCTPGNKQRRRRRHHTHQGRDQGSIRQNPSLESTRVDRRGGPHQGCDRREPDRQRPQHADRARRGEALMASGLSPVLLGGGVFIAVFIADVRR